VRTVPRLNEEKRVTSRVLWCCRAKNKNIFQSS